MTATSSPRSLKSPQAPRFDYTAMIVAGLGFVLIIGVLLESRWYFRNLCAGPLNTTLLEIGNLPPGGVKRNWIRFNCPEILDSGFHTVLKQSWGDSKIESEINVVSNLKIIPVGKRFLAANVPVNHTGTILVGALHPLPDDARQVLGRDLKKADFDKLFLPYILETDVYKTTSAIFWITLAIFSLAICAMAFAGQLKRRQKYLRSQHQNPNGNLPNPSVQG